MAKMRSRRKRGAGRAGADGQLRSIARLHHKGLAWCGVFAIAELTGEANSCQVVVVSTMRQIEKSIYICVMHYFNYCYLLD